ncbi:acyl-CoA dehydrogenase family protein [Oceanobacillus longus]|uniref:Acyl-CoA dehydrogenase family protein n=1 Tax=Oceanobacillus longus TaxID=930120 RepID=A0ABV8H1E4_9BACI
MEFALNEEQQLFQRQTQQIIKSKGDLEIPRAYSEGKEEVLDDLWTGLAELGYMGITVSESYGGLGMGPLTLVPILEEMGRAVIPGPYIETVSFAAPLLEKYGSTEQKEKYLTELATGERKFSLALLEGNGEYAPSNINVRATEKGNEYVLSGEKILVAHADFVDTLIVPVRTGMSEQDISLLLVDRDSTTLQLEKQISMDETRKMVKVTFNDVAVPKSQLLGQENAGWELLEIGVRGLNAALCSNMVGGMERIVETATEYANTRVQFGQPIGRFQAVKHKIVEMKMNLETGRSLSYYAGWALENNTEDVVEAIAMARSLITEAFIKSANDNVQIHGGMGFTWEFDCHFFLKRAKTLENYLGSPEDYREEIVNALVSDKESVAVGR